MSIPFVDRLPTETELERFRLILSSYQEGLVAFVRSSEDIQPDWRDFTRTATAVFNGNIRKINSTFDLILSSGDTNLYYGINCMVNKAYQLPANHKSRPARVLLTLPRVDLIQALKAKGINEHNLSNKINEAGLEIMEQLSLRYQTEMTVNSQIDLDKSSYLILLTNDKGQYQLLQFPYKLPGSSNLRWGIRYRQPNDRFVLFAMNNRSILFQYSISLNESYLGNTPLTYYPSLETATWISELFQMEPLESLRNMEYGILTKAEIAKEAAIEKLEELIRANPDEKAFQKLLTDNPWMFGSEYTELLSRRRWTRDEQQDFMLKRTADGFLEMIEIKTPLNGQVLFLEDDSHHTLYPRKEVSIAVGQVVQYLEKLDAQRHHIQAEDGEDVSKIRAKIIVGLDKGDADQIKALRRLNSHLYRIEILTFDQLLRIAKRVLEYQ